MATATCRDWAARVTSEKTIKTKVITTSERWVLTLSFTPCNIYLKLLDFDRTQYQRNGLAASRLLRRARCQAGENIEFTVNLKEFLRIQKQAIRIRRRRSICMVMFTQHKL